MGTTIAPLSHDFTNLACTLIDIYGFKSKVKKLFSFHLHVLLIITALAYCSVILMKIKIYQIFRKKNVKNL